MCLTMRKADLLKLLTAIIIMFIISLPEFFKTHEEDEKLKFRNLSWNGKSEKSNTVIISCMDACSLSNVTFPLCAYNISSKCLQQRSQKQNVFWKIFVNYSDFQNTPSISQVSGRGLQQCILNSACESKEDMNVHQGPRSEAPNTRGSLERKAKNFISFHKYFNFTVGYMNDESEEYNIYYILEVHIRNSTTSRGNITEENVNHSCITAMMEDQNSCINISLQLQTYVENPMGMPKIIWLVLIAFVFVLTITVVTYKVFQENKKQKGRKYRATAASILQQNDCKHPTESTATKSIQHLSETKQRKPAPIIQTEILPAIPEHEHSQQV